MKCAPRDRRKPVPAQRLRCAGQWAVGCGPWTVADRLLYAHPLLAPPPHSAPGGLVHQIAPGSFVFTPVPPGVLAPGLPAPSQRTLRWHPRRGAGPQVEPEGGLGSRARVLRNGHGWVGVAPEETALAAGWVSRRFRGTRYPMGLLWPGRAVHPSRNRRRTLRKTKRFLAWLARARWPRARSQGDGDGAHCAGRCWAEGWGEDFFLPQFRAGVEWFGCPHRPPCSSLWAGAGVLRVCARCESCVCV